LIIRINPATGEYYDDDESSFGDILLRALPGLLIIGAAVFLGLALGDSGLLSSGDSAPVSSVVAAPDVFPVAGDPDAFRVVLPLVADIRGGQGVYRYRLPGGSFVDIIVRVRILPAFELLAGPDLRVDL